MVRIPGFHCCGPISVPGQGMEILQGTCVWPKINKILKVKKKKKRKRLVPSIWDFPGRPVLKTLNFH